VLAWLSDYFGTAYPFAKLDLVAVPNFRAGAMENAGLVTFREQLLLVDPEHAPLHQRMASLSVIAHELAHMWFGDLVTMEWWDDLWLNESFASWMASRVVEDLEPEYEEPLQAVGYAQYVMQLDSREGTRPIRRPIRHGGDVHNAFDGITYGKGQAVLRMFEAWLGAEVFREGVRQYIATHAHGTATTADLLAALGAASKQDVAALIGPFLDQPGTPLVEVALECSPGAAPELRLSQARFSATGARSAQGETWPVPMCVAWSQAASPELRRRECFVFDTASASHRLDTPTCPLWLHPNADEQGYYRWQIGEESLQKLVSLHGAQLHPAEQVAIPGLLAAQLEAGAVSLSTYLDGLKALSTASQWRVVQGVARGLGRLERTAAEASLAEPYAEFTRTLLLPQLEAIGLDPREAEPFGARLLRPSLLGALADTGRDERVRVRAAQAAQAFIADRDSLPSDLASVWLGIAALDGDEQLWQELASLLAMDLAPWQRSIVVRSLAAFEAKGLAARSFDLVLDGTLRAQDYRSLVRAVRPVSRGEAWEWLEEHYGPLVEVLGKSAAASLPSMGRGFCTHDDARRVERFFSQPDHAPDGTLHNLRLVVEDIERCVRLREAATEPLRDYLARLR
jgi:alanyl aminopeptidase